MHAFKAYIGLSLYAEYAMLICVVVGYILFVDETLTMFMTLRV